MIISDLEYPRPEEKTRDFLYVKGWAFSESDEEIKVIVSMDGNHLDSGICGFPRYDVFEKYQTEGSYSSGFMGRIPLLKFEDGSHSIKIEAKTETEKTVIREVQINKDPGGGMDVAPLGGVGGKMRKTDLGELYLNYFKKYGGIKPDSSVLEIGCGVGRMALPLTGFLNSNGSYHGTDTVDKTVDYCSEHITTRFPNFKFIFSDIYNKMYNPGAKYLGSNYKLPFEDGTFDFIFLTSVFTHLVLNDTKNYLNEISRVLKQGGKCLITYFLINDEIRERIESGKSRFNFGHKFKGFLSQSKETPESAIAYEESLIRKIYRKNNLSIEEPIYFGQWSGLQNTLDQQDIVVASKTSSKNFFLKLLSGAR